MTNHSKENHQETTNHFVNPLQVVLKVKNALTVKIHMTSVHPENLTVIASQTREKVQKTDRLKNPSAIRMIKKLSADHLMTQKEDLRDQQEIDALLLAAKRDLKERAPKDFQTGVKAMTVRTKKEIHPTTELKEEDHHLRMTDPTEEDRFLQMKGATAEENPHLQMKETTEDVNLPQMTEEKEKASVIPKSAHTAKEKKDLKGLKETHILQKEDPISVTNKSAAMKDDLLRVRKNLISTKENSAKKNLHATSQEPLLMMA